LNQKLGEIPMADPLSISASAAGLLSLVIQVADGTYQYATSARNAPSAVASLLKELQALKTVLIKLDDITHNSHSWQAKPQRDTDIVSLLDIESCTAEIKKIQQKLGSRLDVRGRMKLVQHLTWPFLEEKTMQMVKTLHSYVDIFHLALSMDNLSVFTISMCLFLLILL
jgi:translation elongation factor EF-Tu-like GTPase